jgi:DNA-binding PadR family transcriptional regulator
MTFHDAEAGQYGPPHSHHGPRRGRRRHGFGPGFGGPGFGLGPGWGPRGRGRKARRGDIRTAALLLLDEEPRNGYQIMQEVEERSGGLWRPSPGSVYPALAQLEDEGLIRTEERDGRKVFALTEEGARVVLERGEDAPAPWEEVGRDFGGEAVELRRLLGEVAAAYAQVMRSGSSAQVAKAGEVLAGARRELYRILADGGSPEGEA